MVRRDKSRLFVIGLLLIIHCLLAATATATDGEPSAGIAGVSPSVTYNTMLDFFKAGAFDTVISYYDNMNLAGYAQADLYKQYAQARVLLDDGKYQDAYMLFYALPEDFPPEISDSAQWASYAYGMRFFHEKEYKKAAEYLSNAKSIADAGARLAEANEKWMEAQYKSGCDLLNQNEPEMAYVLFEELGDYKDSAKKMVECLEATLVNQGEVPSDKSNISDFTVVQSDTVSIFITWTDSASSGEYRVKYAPDGIIKDVPELIVTDCVVQLDGLIPDTNYCVTITPINGGVPFTGYAKTAPAQFYSGNKFVPQYIALYSYSTMEERQFGLDKLVERNAIVELSERHIAPPFGTLSGSEVGYVLVAPGTCTVNEDDNILKIQWVLRLSGNGTYISNRDVELSEDMFFICIYASINELLDQAYAQYETWPRADGRLELYLDGELLGGVSLSLIQGQ